MLPVLEVNAIVISRLGAATSAGGTSHGSTGAQVALVTASEHTKEPSADTSRVASLNPGRLATSSPIEKPLLATELGTVMPCESVTPLPSAKKPVPAAGDIPQTVPPKVCAHSQSRQDVCHGG